MVKIKNLIELIRALTVSLIGAYFVSIALITVCFFLFFHFHNVKKEKIDNREILTTNRLYQSNLSEQLSIIANSPIFIEYLRSGEVTREKMKIDLLTLLTSLQSDPSIVGLEIDKKAEGEIFRTGDATNSYVVLELCYSAMTLDNKGGNCDKYNLILFFNKQNYVQQLIHFNNDINLCQNKNCQNIDLFNTNKFGSFPITKKSNMNVSLFIENTIFFPMNVMYIGFLLLLLILTIFTYKNTRKLIQVYVSEPIKEITKKLKENDFFTEDKKYPIDEINFLHKQIEDFKAQEKDAKIGSVATQLAHDIKSPLTTLNIMMRILSNSLSEDHRITLRGSINRIQDIANNLLKSYRLGEITMFSQPDNENRKLYLACEIESLISQKRIEIIGSKPVNINLNLDDCAYDLFIYANIDAINRVLSNLINNAVESIDCDGNVDINLRRSNENALIVIQDNGKGIPLEILDKIGYKKLTYGKREGSGLGMYNAYQMIKNFSGNISIKTRPEINGTQIEITLPLVSPPNFFVKDIKLGKYKHIIILDDDQNIHNVWEMRINSIAFNRKPEVEHLHSVAQLEEWFFLERRNFNEYLFLIDYEIIGSDKTGLAVIETYELKSHAILVTSRFEEPEIQKKCEMQGIFLLPKSMSIYIPFK